MRLPMIALVVVLTISILIDIAISRQTSTLKRFRPMVKWTNIAMSVVLDSAIALLAFDMQRIVAVAGMSGVMYLLYAYISLVLAKALYLLVILLAEIKPLRHYAKALRIAALACAAAVLWQAAWAALATRYDTHVTQVTASFPSLPAAFDGYRIIQFSDLHAGGFGNDTTYVARLVDLINGQRPQLIVFTGDLVSSRSRELLPFMPALSRLRAEDGVCSVLGNHDYGDYCRWPNEAQHRADVDTLRRCQQRMGWQLLCNDHLFIHRGSDSLALIGVENWGEPPFTRYGNLRKAYPAAADSVFKILLSHNPSHWSAEVVTATNIDLTLSGHTHAMQMAWRLFGKTVSPASRRYRHWGGSYREGEQQLYVNIGTGTVGIPARFGCAYPEVTLITLKRQK